MPAVEEHLTAMFYVFQALSNSVDEPRLVRNSQDKGFKDYN